MICNVYVSAIKCYISNQLLFIVILVGDLIADDTSTIETLRNHAKTLGGIVGAEYKFLEDKRPLEEKLEEEKLFHDQNYMKLYDLRFK